MEVRLPVCGWLRGGKEGPRGPANALCLRLDGGFVGAVALLNAASCTYMICELFCADMILQRKATEEKNPAHGRVRASFEAEGSQGPRRPRGAPMSQATCSQEGRARPSRPRTPPAWAPLGHSSVRGLPWAVAQR